MRVAILSIIASLLLLAPDSQALLPSLRLLPKQIDGKLPARRTRISGNALDEGQLSLMETDCCIQVDENDRILGPVSKKNSHVFGSDQPRGQLHRAFSVFLFDDSGRLLLQQRAAQKITFPGVWTNTCCSHPLFGMEVDEVDSDDAVSRGEVPGIKCAAVRKLQHELGIALGTLDPARFKYLTRLHYWAADVVTHGEVAPWGEHEIDYILFYRMTRSESDAVARAKSNPEEVDETRYVDQEGLRAMMHPDSGLLWSPWFRIVANQFLNHWWANLSETIDTDIFVKKEAIFRFDPGIEHFGGAGGAREWLGEAVISRESLTNY